MFLWYASPALCYASPIGFCGMVWCSYGLLWASIGWRPPIWGHTLCASTCIHVCMGVPVCARMCLNVHETCLIVCVHVYDYAQMCMIVHKCA